MGEKKHRERKKERDGDFSSFCLPATAPLDRLNTHYDTK